MEYCAHFWALLYKTDIDVLHQVQWRVTEMVRGPQNTVQEERLRGLGLFIHNKRRLMENFTGIRLPSEVTWTK